MDKRLPRGVTPAVLLCNPKYEHNVGSALRACSCFDIKQLWWTGDRVVIDKDRGERLPREERLKGYQDVAWNRTDYPFDQFEGPITPVCVELKDGSEPLTTFVHPENPIYVFGPEDGSVSQVMRRHCHRFVHIQSRHCLNLAGALYVVLAHRLMQLQQQGAEPILVVKEMLNEHRGAFHESPVLDSMGWDGT